MNRRRSSKGMTLLEVVLALAVLAIAMAMLSQLVGIGIRASKEARLITQGQLLAEAVVSEIAAGALAASSGPVPSDPTWNFNASFDPATQSGVVRLVVTVQKSNDELGTTVTLVRMMRDPNLAIPEEETTTDDSDSGLSGATSL